MLGISLAPIDWERPWYASIRSAAQNLSVHGKWIYAITQQCEAASLRNHLGHPLSFVGQAALPAGIAYESFISATGCIPTRDNPHDFFNALVWLSFPRIKRQLNALQAAQIAQAGVGESRGTTRDAVTIFDENAALLVVSDTAQGRALVAALREHDWRAAFVEQGGSFGRHAEVWLFGHALMEKLLAPYKGITAHAWVITAPGDFHLQSHDARREWIDLHVAHALAESVPSGSENRAAHGLSTARFTPLPVLGLPGWSPLQDEAFYKDASVFRPKRRS